MNGTDVANRVKRQFGDEAGVQITDADILRWINDGQLQIVMENDNVFEATALANVVAGTAEYDSPTNIRALRSLMHNGIRLNAMSFAEFNEYIDGYSKTNSVYGRGIPEVFMVWNDKITLFPTPQSNLTNGLKIFYQAKPATMAVLSENLSVPEEYHPAVVNYCLAQAYELDENMNQAAYKAGQFSETIQKLSYDNKTTTQEYYPRITTLPEDQGYDYGSWGGVW